MYTYKNNNNIVVQYLQYTHRLNRISFWLCNDTSAVQYLDDSPYSIVANNILARLEVPPWSRRADTDTTPPFINIVIPRWLAQLFLVVQCRADAAPVIRVDKLTRALPLEVRVIQLVILIENVQILGQLFGRSELIHMYVRTTWRTHLVVLGSCAHYNGQHLTTQRINEELLRYVVPAIGVLECQIELVVVIEYIEAFVRRAARTLVVAAGAIYVHLVKGRQSEGFIN